MPIQPALLKYIIYQIPEIIQRFVKLKRDVRATIETSQIVKDSLAIPPSVTINLATILGTQIILTMANIASEVKFITHFYQLIK